ncbi:MAG TPA: phosphatase PAP2 family protein [Ktedonobacteraceae bacterium]|nr:phosphatase PAP2 family protein [Ktedonobacteraceae bacterium]
MMKLTNPKGTQTFTAPTTAVAEKWSNAHIWQRVGAIVWCLGFILLMVCSVIVHSHPGPWPFDLQTSLYVQGLHLWAWVIAFLTFINYFNNGIPAGVELALWFVILLILRQFRYALFIGLGPAVLDALNGLLGNIVARPRPSPHLVHVTMAEPTYSFPSGHVQHCLVYYGILLYISFTPPLRQWRYRWLLLPFQILAILTILCVGFARIEAGSHWLTDVLGGFLSGALLLTILILLYRWASVRFAHRGAKKHSLLARQHQ